MFFVGYGKKKAMTEIIYFCKKVLQIFAEIYRFCNKDTEFFLQILEKFCKIKSYRNLQNFFTEFYRFTETKSLNSVEKVDDLGQVY